MGLTEWFLGIHFSWRFTNSDVAVHLNQSGYAANLVKQFSWDSWDPTPTATPYCSEVPINSIAPSTNENSSPAQLCQTEAYQSQIGSTGWLATATCPDLSTVHSFLSYYNGKPSSGHMHATLYALHYIHLTHNHGISFSSTTPALIHTYLHFPDSADVKAYSDAKPPSLDCCAPLTTYSNACWGSQIGSTVQDGTLLLLFKFCSMSGGIIIYQGGPIAWMSVRQKKTSLSSCEAEICATYEISILVVSLWHLANNVCKSGHNIHDTLSPFPIYNDNEVCVQWSHNMTAKQIRHMEMRKNAVCEWVQDSSLKVLYFKSKTNPADIFTKEMKDGAYF
jgi:hypothetical protein